MRIRNRSAERDIRDWLAGNGYDGKSVQFDEVELHAIKRPGWLQVFRFELRCTTTETEITKGQRKKLFGAMKDDERYGRPEVIVSEDPEIRNSHLAQWSDGLIVHRSARRS